MATTTTTNEIAERAAARRRWVMLGLVLVAQFMVVLTAAGAGLAWQILFLVATAKVRPEESGLASGLVNSAQHVGAAIGLAALAVVAAARTSHVLAQAGGRPSASQSAAALVFGFQRGYVIAGIIVAVAAVVALLGVRATEIAHPPEFGAAADAVEADAGLGAVEAAGAAEGAAGLSGPAEP